LPHHRVLDLGCGTGTLAIMVKRAQPEARVAGLDGDPEMLEQARAKSAAAGVEIEYEEGLSTALPFDDGSFERVLSTLFFHHLAGDDKRRTLSEVHRVLAPGGELHVADWGRPSDPLMSVLSWQVRLLDGIERTRENFEGRLPGLFADAGLSAATERDRLRTAIGTLALYSAVC
jgi:ubiquinone/menaquinone biosynthesis C-methylase UbiE